MRSFEICVSRSHQRQRGATLLEVLISIIILALGLLGYAGLQTVSLKGSNTAYYRSLATMVSYDLIDRMRVDKAKVVAGDYDMNYGTTPSAAEAQDWKTNNFDGLFPGGQAKVIYNGGSKSVQVYIKWLGDDDLNNDGAADDTEFMTETTL